MPRICLVFIFLLCFARTQAQSYEKEYVTLFTFQVKQINEFIERFNNDDSTLVKLYYKQNNPSKVPTREQLIKSLFNAEKKNWNYQEINNFIDTVNNKINPLKLHLLGDNWYVKLVCPIYYKNVAKTATLTLKLQPVKDGIYKWVITGVSAPFLNTLKTGKKYDKFQLPTPEDNTTALNSISNAIDFMDIDKVSEDLTNISNYFERRTSYKDDLPVFVEECLKGHLKITSPNRIGYYFTQIPGWLLEIKRFNRRTRNSGWLISALVKVNTDK